MAVLSAAVPAAAVDPSREAAMAGAFAAHDAGAYADAFRAWRRLAEGGDTLAMTALANMLYQGEGRARDTAAAARWYRHAARLGDAVAQLNPGDMFCNRACLVKLSIYIAPTGSKVLFVVGA